MPIPEPIQESLFEGKLEEVEGLLRAYLKEQPDDDDAQTEFIRVLLGLRKIKEAGDMIGAMFEVDPNDSAALGLRGLWHEFNGRLDEARADYAASLESDAEQTDVMYNLGRLCVVAVDFNAEVAEQAETLLKRVIELVPDHFQAHHQLAALYTRLGRPEEAVQSAYNTIERNPLHVPSYLFLGEIFSNLGQVDDVIELYKAGLRVNPLVHAFRDELLRLYKQEERLDAAFEIALEQSQSRGAFEDFLELGQLSLVMQNPQAAEVAFLKAEEVNSQDWRAPYNLGEVYRGTELWEQAEDAYHRSLEHSETAEALTGLALIYQASDEAEDQEQAIVYFQQALGMSPHEPVFLLNLALALHHAGRVDEIRDTLTRVEPLLPADDPSLLQVRSLL